LNFGTGTAPQREGRQVTEAEATTEDQQQEEAADCELSPKPAAAGSQGSNFGSLLGKRKHTK